VTWAHLWQASRVSGVRDVGDDEIRPVAAALARAFHDDPVMTWLFGTHPERRLRRLRRYFVHEAKRHRAHGEVLTEDGLHGGAFWDPPGRWRETWGDVLRSVPALLPAIGPRIPRALRGLSIIEAAHPREPHWYLSVLGTEPAAQRRGIGGRLLTPVLDRCDDQGIGAYLESSKEQNLAFYARFGFTVTGELTLPQGPPLWPMWREPKAP
jgi:GNAT superfamily N-acetyltransferase